jgi:alkaline phosphatase D
MRNTKLFLLSIVVPLSVVTFHTFALGQTTVLEKQSVWKYFTGDQYPDSLWNQPEYDDGAWPTGPGILGYGENYINTTVPYGPDPNDKYITTCFRHSFELSGNPAEIARLTLSANHDDGFVAYINGQEVARKKMPTGDIDYSTSAYSHESGTYEPIDVSDHVGMLVTGTNLIAVEVHQVNSTSSDLAWDMELSSSDSWIEFIWSGSVTTNSARVKAKLAKDNAVVRLAVSEEPEFLSPIYSAPDTALTEINNRVVSLEIDGLVPDQRYYYAPDVDGLIDLESIGRFRSFPADTGSFSVAFASCATTGSNHTVFETIRQIDPLLFIHTGDFHYENIAVNDRDEYRQAYEAVLSSPNQSEMFRNIPLAYIWDDHDFGPNNCDSTTPGREAARLTYQEYVPHYPLVAGSGDVPIYQAFTVGRVRFIVCDSRSARSPYSAPDNLAKTMLGAEQKEWFKQELLSARYAYALIVWVNSLPWIGETGDDGWYSYTHEREELASFIAENDITNLCMISGDAHMLAIDDGTNSDYASGGGAAFPVMHAAALDRSGSIKGGPYSHGAYPGKGQFGLMTVTDTGDSVFVDWVGTNFRDDVVVSHTFTFPVYIATFCGDIDGDGTIVVADAQCLLNSIFLIGYPWFPTEITDVNCSGGLDIDDVVYLIFYLFMDGPEPCADCP